MLFIEIPEKLVGKKYISLQSVHEKRITLQFQFLEVWSIMQSCECVMWLEAI
jgi:hypothetical protein